MRSVLAAVLVSAVGCLSVGCSVNAERETEDGVLEDGTGIESAEDALTSPGQSTFYRVTRQDFRKCAWPMCGGVYVARVNQSVTKCVDGTWQKECYVADFDLAALPAGTADKAKELARAGRALVRGAIELRKTEGGVAASTFVASEAWEPRLAGEPSGYFSRLTQREFTCKSLNCATHDIGYLNASLTAPVHSVRLDGVAKDVVTDVQTLLTTERKTGVLVAGWTYLGGVRRTLVPSQIYTPMKAAPGGGAGASCGSRGLQPCAEGVFCSFPSGANCGRSDAPGTCAKRAEVCIEIYQPVCGCDGQTYGNACKASSAGVSVEFTGECPKKGGSVGDACGGIAGFACAEGLYCNFPIEAMCGAADQMGACAEKTEVCTKIYAPVCGCDDKTYGNPCMAASAGVSISAKGECATK